MSAVDADTIDRPVTTRPWRTITMTIGISARRRLLHWPRHAAQMIALSITLTFMLVPRAYAGGGPVVLEAMPLQKGRTFACRIPVEVRNEGSIPLRSITVI